MQAGEIVGERGSARPRRHWGRLMLRCAGLLLRPRAKTSDLVARSYDHIASGYDQVWTTHMRDLSLVMLGRLPLQKAGRGDERAIDLTCGTGFLTGELARLTGGQVVGVDASAGMLDEARRRQRGPGVRFVRADAVDYLRSLAPGSVDVITCGWGLGYTRPLAAVREISRVLRPGGCVGIIDNSLFSLAEVLWCSVLAFAERPEALAHVMKVRFLLGSVVLTAMMRACGLAVRWRLDGSRTYHVGDGESAIARLTATGAAAGFEFAAVEEHTDAIFSRFARIMEERYRTAEGVPITHRYLAAVGVKLSR
ncbi:MAG: class I SAM-dependent methyltransferase [Phycisphaerae bacterium]|nr:class I SAM-dependent methyltransferase [Phycisphaerae bacterium]